MKPIKSKRQPNLNENYFSVIDSEEKAYVLGFIFADGYVESNERTLTININKRDIDILYKIKNCLKCGNEIKKSSTESCVRLYLSSVKLVSDLKVLGVSRNKSLIVPFPKLEDNLYRHFLRGFFDGDGHIGKRQCALIVGSDSFCEGFEDYIKSKFGTSLYKNNMGIYHRIQFNRSNHNIIKWMYKDCNIYLNRKMEMYINHWDGYTERVRSRG